MGVDDYLNNITSSTNTTFCAECIAGESGCGCDPPTLKLTDLELSLDAVRIAREVANTYLYIMKQPPMKLLTANAWCTINLLLQSLESTVRLYCNKGMWREAECSC